MRCRGIQIAPHPLISLTPLDVLTSLHLWHTSASFDNCRGLDRPTFVMQQGFASFPTQARLDVAQSRHPNFFSSERMRSKRTFQFSAPLACRASSTTSTRLQAMHAPSARRASVGFPADSRLLANRFHGTSSWGVAPPKTHVCGCWVRRPEWLEPYNCA